MGYALEYGDGSDTLELNSRSMTVLRVMVDASGVQGLIERLQLNDGQSVTASECAEVVQGWAAADVVPEVRYVETAVEKAVGWLNFKEWEDSVRVFKSFVTGAVEHGGFRVT